ncbi:MAG: HpcH/HpaI aldolase/citrate lyase family protein [Armatimonadota bacterium]
MVSNRALEKIRAGQPAFGLSMGMNDPIVAELFARSGVDWVWIDDQHGAFDRSSVLRAIQVITPYGTTPIVRIASNDFFRIGRSLDAGALGIIVPMVNSAEEAEQAVFAAKYPPRGGRSRGGARLFMLGDDYFERANDNLLLAVMVETPQAVERCGEIAAVDGVDCIMIGPSDLALSLGVPPGSDEHEAAIAQVLERTTAAGKAAGMPCATVEDALRWAEKGFRLVHCGSEFGMLRTGISHVQQALGIGPH